MKQLLNSKKASFFSQLFDAMADLLSSGIVILMLVIIFIGLTGTFFIGDSSLDDNEATIESFIQLINFIDNNKEKISFEQYDYGITIQPGNLLFNLPFGAKACSKYSLVLKNAEEKYPECFAQGKQCLCICKMGDDESTAGRKTGDEFCLNENLLCSSQYYEKEETNMLVYENQDGDCVQIAGAKDQQNIGILKAGQAITICEPGKSSSSQCTSYGEKTQQTRIMKVLVDKYRQCLANADVVKMWNDPEAQGFVRMRGSKQYDEAAFAYQPDLSQAKQCDTLFKGEEAKIPKGYKLKITYDGYLELYKDNVLFEKSHIFFYKDKEHAHIVENSYDNHAIHFLRDYELREYQGKKYADTASNKNGALVCFSNNIHKDYYDNEYALWLDEGDEYAFYDIGFTQFGVGMVCIASPTGEIKPASEELLGKELVMVANDPSGNCPNKVNKAREFIDLEYPGKQSKLWIPKQARCGGKFPLLMPLHGKRDSSNPEYNIYLDNKKRGKQFNLIAQEYIDKSQSVPLLIAAPMDNVNVEETDGLKRWLPENFDVALFINEINKKLAVYNIEISSVSIMGHSNALCSGGVERAVSKVEMYTINLAEGTCKNSNYGKQVAEANKNPKAIITHMYQRSKGFEGDRLSSEYLVGAPNFDSIPASSAYVYARKHPTLPRYSFNVDLSHTEIPKELLKEILPRFFNPKQAQEATKQVS